MFGRFLEASHLNGVHQTEDLDHFVGGDRSRVVLVIHPECPPSFCICDPFRFVRTWEYAECHSYPGYATETEYSVLSYKGGQSFTKSFKILAKP